MHGRVEMKNNMFGDLERGHGAALYGIYRDARIHRLEDKIKYKSSGIHRLKTNTNTHQEEI